MATEKRLIYLEDAYEAVTDLSGQAETKSAYAAFWKAGKEIQKLPTVDAVEVVHGRWRKLKELPYASVYYCSICGKPEIRTCNYCPCCGANMMDGDTE